MQNKILQESNEVKALKDKESSNGDSTKKWSMRSFSSIFRYSTQNKIKKISLYGEKIYCGC